MPIRFGSAEARQILDCDESRGDWMRDVVGYGHPAPMPERDCHGNTSCALMTTMTITRTERRCEMAVIEAEMHVVEQVEQQAAFDYAQIDEAVRDEVREAAKKIRAYGESLKGSMIAIGKRLIGVKDILPHGQFEAWIAAEFEMSDRMARNFMNVARLYEGKTEIISVLSDTVLYMLAAPSTSDAVRAEIEQRAIDGESVKVADVRAAKQVERAAVQFAEPKPVTAKPEPEPEMPRHLARAGYQLVRARNGDTDKWGWQWQVDIPGSGDGLGKGGDRHIGPWVAQPLDAIQGATEHHARRQGAARQGARAVYVETAGAEPEIHPDPIVGALTLTNPHGDEFANALNIATLDQLIAAQSWIGDAYGPWGQRGYVAATRWNMIGHRRGVLESSTTAALESGNGAPVVDEFGPPSNMAFLEGQEYVEARLARDEAQADAAPHALPDDLAAAGFQLIQPRQGAWAILRDTGPIPFESDWRMEADIDLAIEEARAFLGENAYAAFEAWLNEGPREPSLRECVAILEYAKRIVGRVRALEPSLDALAGAVLPPWSQLINAVERKVKGGGRL